jgi:hypothetical protein
MDKSFKIFFNYTIRVLGFKVLATNTWHLKFFKTSCFKLGHPYLLGHNLIPYLSITFTLVLFGATQVASKYAERFHVKKECSPFFSPSFNKNLLFEKGKI